jgi:hypothetical protein
MAETEQQKEYKKKLKGLAELFSFLESNNPGYLTAEGRAFLDGYICHNNECDIVSKKLLEKMHQDKINLVQENIKLKSEIKRLRTKRFIFF